MNVLSAVSITDPEIVIGELVLFNAMSWSILASHINLHSYKLRRRWLSCLYQTTDAPPKPGRPRLLCDGHAPEPGAVVLLALPCRDPSFCGYVYTI